MQPATASSKRPSATFDRRPQPLKCAHPAVPLQASVNRKKALQLRLQGLSFRQIGQALGVQASTAHGYVQVAWAKLNRQTDKLRRQLRQQELARLGTLHRHYWPIATRDHLRPLDPAQGPAGPLVIHQADLEEQLHAIDQLLRISTRRCLLLGLITPEQVDADAIDDKPEAPVGVTSKPERT